jgi:diaminopimelate epimerase
MSGAGNTFVVIDDREHALSREHLQRITPALCARHGSGHPPAEGVLVLRALDTDHFDGEFLNPDGSYGAMCGNGGRCIVRFAHQRQSDSANTIRHFTLSERRYGAAILDDTHVRITFDWPIEYRDQVEGLLQRNVSYVNVNSDHAVVHAADIESAAMDFRGFDLACYASPIRHAAVFPRGANVNVFTVGAPNVIDLRTFERGVEAETGACGTGALSTAFVAWQRGLVGSRVTVVPPSGRPLTVEIDEAAHTLSLSGDAVYDGPPYEVDEHTGSIQETHHA